MARYLAAAAIVCASPAVALRTTISNVVTRRDIYGSIVNSHSGNLYRFDGTFYLYGTAYPNCTQTGPICQQHCGYYNNTFAVYSSPDLVAWTLLSDNLVPEINGDAAVIEYDEVNVGYNANTSEYVMSFWSGHYGFHNVRTLPPTAYLTQM